MFSFKQKEKELLNIINELKAENAKLNQENRELKSKIEEISNIEKQEYNDFFKKLCEYENE